MIYRQLGRTGLKVSPFCLGAMNFGSATAESEAIDIIHAAIRNNINIINTADVDYSGVSEIIVGKALSRSSDREKVILSVEISGPDMGVPFEPNLSRNYIINACEKALKRLNTDYIDIYNIPRPNSDIPIEEVLATLTNLVYQGKIRYFGTSTFPGWMIMEAISIAASRNYLQPSIEVPPYNLLDRRIENEIIPLTKKYQVGLLTWAPLAQGVLAGRYTSTSNYPSDSRAARLGGLYHNRINERGIQASQQIIQKSKEFGKSAAQLAFLWVKDRDGVTAPIVGVRTLEHLLELLPMVETKLTEDEEKFMNSINSPGSAISDFHNSAPWMKMKVQNN